MFVVIFYGGYKISNLKYSSSDIVYEDHHFFAIKDEKKGGFWICKKNDLWADVVGFTSYFNEIEQLIKFVQSLRNDKR